MQRPKVTEAAATVLALAVLAATWAAGSDATRKR
jgi:hypothetical protein